MLPCATKSNCPCEGNPVGNFSSEAPDKDVFLGFSTGAVATVPQPGTPFDNSTGYNFCESEESQEAADLCAAQGAITNNADNGNPSTPPGNTANDGGNWGVALYQNSEQSCTVDCPNGGQFTYVVPAGTVTDLNPTIVDRAAASLACKNANKFLICIGTLDNVTGTVGTGYFGTVVLTGSFAPYRWTATTPLPAGLTLDADTAGDTVLSKTVGIIGTPTASGAQSFTLRATDREGHYAERAFTITVAGGNLSRYWSFDHPGDPVSAPDPYFGGGSNVAGFTDEKTGLILCSDFHLTGPPWPHTIAGKIAIGEQATNFFGPAPDYNSTTQQGFTLFGWFKFTSIGGATFIPLSLELPVLGNPAPGIIYDTGTSKFTIPSGATASAPSSTAAWFFIAYTFNNSTGDEKMYFNGALLLSGNIGTFPGTGSGTTFKIQPTDPANDFGVDEVGMSINTAYSAAQILSLYNGGAGKTWPAVNSV